MFKKRYMLVIAALFVSGCSNGIVGNEHVPEPAKQVDLQRYLGRWYEIARYENRFETNCEAVTAEYGKRDDGLISVVNTCHHDSVNGAVEVAEGKAKIVENSGNAKLKVSFFGPFFFGDYWVLDHGDDYSWSIVGEPSGTYLWILARNAHLSNQQKAQLTDRAKALGYDVSLLRETKH